MLLQAVRRARYATRVGAQVVSAVVYVLTHMMIAVVYHRTRVLTMREDEGHQTELQG